MLHTLFLVTTMNLSLPPNLLEAVCKVETNHKVSAIHHNDGKGSSLGICQIKMNTAKLMGFKGTEKDLMDPETNVLYAGLYLKHQIQRYNSIPLGIIAYNQGSVKSLTSTAYQRKVYKEWQLKEQQWIANLHYQPIQPSAKNTPYSVAYCAISRRH